MKNLFLSLLFFNLFLVSCTSNNERKSEAFLRKFLLEEGGIYTLAGDKPITDTLIFVGTEVDISLDGLGKESLEKVEYIEDPTLEDWNAWKKYSKNLQSKNFRFIERPCPYDPLHVMYLLVNLEKLKAILGTYRAIFSAETGVDCDMDQIVDELADPKSVFWNRAFSNHYLTGLLHGYGEENSRHFTQVCEGNAEPKFSDQAIGSASQDEFPLPIFAIAGNDQQSAKYREQREQIQQTYRNQKFMKKTMELLKK